MDTRDIRYFLKIAELSHLGKAAEILHISQPALSKAVTRLEQAYGVHLFDRVGRGIALTEAGQLLRERFRMLDEDLNDIRREVSSYGKGIAGTVRLGCSASIGSFFLPAVCKLMQSRAPEVHLHVSVAMDDMLRNSLRAGELDVIISPERAGPDGQALTSRPLLRDTVVVVAREGHPLGKRASLTDMAASRWILPAKTVSTRQWLQTVFVDAGFEEPNVVVTATPLVSAPYIMAETELLSFMSQRNLAPGRGLVEIANRQTTLKRNFDVSHSARSYLSPAVRYFIAQAQIIATSYVN
jgi:DNA-binding transcriptional LysR family regulator